MSFRDLKAASRRTVHRTFAVPCLLARGDRAGSGDIALTARLHNKMALGGDLNGEGYSNIIEGIQRVIFNRDEFATAFDGGALTLVRNDVVTFPDYVGTGLNIVVSLDARDPYEGPVDEKWSVVPV